MTPSIGERAREVQRGYRARNRAAILERRRADYRANREHYTKRAAEWRKANPAKVTTYARAYSKQQYRNFRAELTAAYGARCACCGEAQVAFLDLDHINNDGKADRVKHGSQLQLYRRLKKAGWPRDNYRLLCCNCNMGRARNGGVCPHAN